MTDLTLLQIFCILLSSFLLNNVQSSSEGSYFFYQQPVYPRDCQEVFQQCSTNNVSGVYLIKPDGYGEAFEVYCDNQVDGGGWTVFHSRNEGNFVEFGRTFSEYREGFGFLSSELWLGNEKISFLTNQKRYQLRIDMTNSAGSSFYVTYDLFRISDEWSNYKLTSVGQYGGNAESYISQGPASTPSAPSVPTDCYDVYTSGSPDGVYTIQPTGWTSSFEVYCNMSDGGGWTVLQRRVDGSVSFNNNWEEYKAGFGSAGPNENVWLGNEILYHMTNQKNYSLRIDVTKLDDDENWYMNYDFFRVNNENNNYLLELGTYTGNAGFDYMRNHRGRQFSTPDRDNDAHNTDFCAFSFDGGWWYGYCFNANLNGVYGRGDFELADGATGDRYRLQYTQMKIRPI